MRTLLGIACVGYLGSTFSEPSAFLSFGTGFLIGACVYFDLKELFGNK
jgi:hypothetical protein